MQFWYNVNPNSPWMNRCGLTSGKKSLVTAQNQTMISKKKKNQGVQQRNELDTGAELEVFPGQAIKKTTKKYPPTCTTTYLALFFNCTRFYLGLHINVSLTQSRNSHENTGFDVLLKFFSCYALK